MNGKTRRVCLLAALCALVSLCATQAREEKDEGKAEELDRTLYDLADGLRVVAIALSSYLPETADRILAALGQPGDLAWEEVAYGRTVPAEGIAAAEPLFPRVELETAVA